MNSYEPRTLVEMSSMSSDVSETLRTEPKQEVADERTADGGDDDDEKREEEKSERDARIDALQQICKESLESDRKEARLKHAAANRETLRLENEKHPFPDGLLSEPDLTAIGKTSEEHHAAEPQTNDDDCRDCLHLAHTDLSAGEEERGFEPLIEEEEEDLEEDKEEDELPWHHVQLYALYGKDADYFLHPKIQTEKKVDIVLNPRLKTIGGRAGAGVLWDVLRNESRMRLVRQDSKLLSPELKSAFGAFAREGLANNKKPVTRNYHSSDDVPDLEKLMDQSRIHNAQDFRHKVELMFRSSTINQNRTKVLLYNNPPPDMNNQEGLEGVQRYMPSWSNRQHDGDDRSESSYMKWMLEEAEMASSGDGMPRTPFTDRTPREDKTPRSSRHGGGKYVFLTEEGATTPGQFTERHRKLEESKGRPAQHSTPERVPVLLKSQSAMATLGGRDADVSMATVGDLSQSNDSCQQRAHSEMSSQFISQWEPLSLNALQEYKQSHDALGEGSFNHGKTSTWTSSKPALSAT